MFCCELFSFRNLPFHIHINRLPTDRLIATGKSKRDATDLAFLPDLEREEFFNLIASIIRACSENFVLAEAGSETNTEMNESTAPESRLMRDKESWPSPNHKTASAQNQGSGKKG